MPFSPKNTPVSYTIMIKLLDKERLFLFVDTKHIIHIDTDPVIIICYDKINIDDTLIYYYHAPTLYRCFSCTAQVFTKYEFFRQRIEVVGHELTT